MLAHEKLIKEGVISINSVRDTSRKLIGGTSRDDAEVGKAVNWLYQESNNLDKKFNIAQS